VVGRRGGGEGKGRTGERVGKEGWRVVKGKMGGGEGGGGGTGVAGRGRKVGEERVN